MADQPRVSGSVDISIDVGKRLGVSLKELSPDAAARIRRILLAVSATWTERMLRLWPVQTRRSQQQWHSRIRGLVWLLANPVDYAEFVHRAGGTVHDPVWKELEALSEELLGQVLPQLKTIAEAGRVVPAGPSLASRVRSRRKGLDTTDLLRASARAYQRVDARRRERLRDTQRTRSRPAVRRSTP